MTTNNSIDSNIPIGIAKGGTNSTSHVDYSTFYYDTSALTTLSSTGLENQVLLSNGAGVASSYQSVGGSHILSSAFLVNLSSSVPNITGNGATYTVIWDSEIYDVGGDFNTVTGEFTAPSSGQYFLASCVNMNGTTLNNSYKETISTSNRDYSYSGRMNGELYLGVGVFQNSVAKVIAVYADMDAGDTAVSKVWSSDSASDDNGILATSASYFCGYLAN